MIVTTPPLTLVTIPEVEPTVAIALSLLLQVPEGVAELSVEVLQKAAAPVIDAGVGLTVTGATLEHEPLVKVILALPDDIPVTRPEVDPIDAIAELLLVHIPEAATSVSVTDAPWHIAADDGVMVRLVLKLTGDDAIPLTTTSIL